MKRLSQKLKNSLNKRKQKKIKVYAHSLPGFKLGSDLSPVSHPFNAFPCSDLSLTYLKPGMYRIFPIHTSFSDTLMSILEGFPPVLEYFYFIIIKGLLCISFHFKALVISQTITQIFDFNDIIQMPFLFSLHCYCSFFSYRRSLSPWEEIAQIPDEDSPGDSNGNVNKKKGITKNSPHHNKSRQFRCRTGNEKRHHSAFAHTEKMQFLDHGNGRAAANVKRNTGCCRNEDRQKRF